MDGATPHVVILGAGFGGLHAARTLAKLPVRVTLIDRENYHNFQPLLYQVATAALASVDVAVPVRVVFRRAKNVTVLLDEVTGVNIASKEVRLRDGVLSYDYLIVATGSTHSYFGHDDWERFAPGLKTIDDALEIRSRILLAFEDVERQRSFGLQPDPVNIVIVGGGATGVELAGSLADFARLVLAPDFRLSDPRLARVTLIEGAPRLLPQYPEDLSHNAEQKLKKMGVEVLVNTTVTHVEEGLVRTTAGVLPSKVTLWAAGVKASPVAGFLGVPLTRRGQVQVNPDLSVPGHPEIFVIGDLAALNDPAGHPYPGLAQVAIEEGRHSASSIGCDVQHKTRKPFRFKLRGNMAVIGRNAAVAEIGKWHITGFLAWVAWLTIHLVWLIGFSNRIVVLIRWAWAYLLNDRRARIITGVDGLRREAEEQTSMGQRAS
jgi:NADH:ubiquinone reductase (H+-translocating)